MNEESYALSAYIIKPTVTHLLKSTTKTFQQHMLDQYLNPGMDDDHDENTIYFP